jgi:hypothetical protein
MLGAGRFPRENRSMIGSMTRSLPLDSATRFAKPLAVARLLAVGMLAATSVGCAPSPIGDPCVPESIPPNGFDAREVYLETSSVQCRTRVCMVYQLQGRPDSICGSPGADPANCADPVAVDTQIFCSCRCSVPEGAEANTPLCNCGEGFTCVDDIVTTGGPGVRGGYCVPCIREGNPDNLPGTVYEDCPTPG